ncbi:MFS transporter [Steroidobacter agaridevorans]|uniref:MFS transporter n=1 Tax=Steroidobacter agaridevorans TaxID=2695856 RepID=UPI001326D3B1|nr:MFS transporter [Steroidobacter agaridevorans]GFE86992.1 MFS transporter [Steroidobacter agaridevorans]
MNSSAFIACDESVIRGTRAGDSPCPEQAKPWVLAATIVGSSMAFIDTSVVNVALPAIQADLAAAVREAQWIVNAYMLMLGALLLVGGAAGDRFGRRRVFIIGVTVFAAASVACAWAPNAGALIAARAVQGVGGAMLVPGSLAIISAMFPEQERGRAIGTWAGASALTTALGPVLGGWLVDTWSWRIIFLINVPIAVVAVALTIWRMPESRDEASDVSVDWAGGALAVVGLGALAYGLTLASEQGWRGAIVLGSLALAIVMLSSFLWREARASHPMMPLELFRSRNFSGANAITLLLYFALGGAMFFIPFNLIRIQGYSAALAGAAFLPFSLIMGVLSRWSGGLIDRYGARTLLTVGPAIVGIGFALLAVPGIGGSYWTTFFPPMVVVGFGMAVSVAPLTTSVMRAVDDRHAGVASGINNATARIAGMLAVAVLGMVAVAAFGKAVDERVDRMSLSNETRALVRAEIPKLAEAQPPRSMEEAQRDELQLAFKESFVYSFRLVSLVAAALAFASAVCGWLTIEPKRRS